MSFLTVSNISKQGLDGLILDDISFQLRRHQRIAIAGETGSGKSSLLKIVAGLVQPDSGSVVFEGSRVDGRDVLVPGHADIAYLAQDFELPKSLRVEQVLEYARKQSAEEQRHLHHICHIDHLLKRRTNELSGGERQRVAIARLLAGMPKLLILDEPYTNLDRIHKLVLKKVLDEVSRLGITCMMISHEPAELLSWADSLIILRHGKMVQRGSPRQLYHSPKNAYVASLLGSYTAMNERTPGFGQYLNQHPDVSHFIRPEWLLIGDTGVQGTIKAVRFLGNHYEIEVECQQLVVTVMDVTGRYQVGDAVLLQLEPHDHL
ncbi:ABC transporter ATP-binding protein [Chryseolinea sp. T2]|uniref:ABC transporter ATP-binding protein n=1 Tax=Chryseolinea sp. T2 TaxID=3129255 RepID=UPI003077F107